MVGSNPTAFSNKRVINSDPNLGVLLGFLYLCTCPTKEGQEMPLLDHEYTIHVRVDGRSFDVPADRLGLAGGSSDDQIKQRVAGFLEIPFNRLSETVIDRHANGNITVRPQAVFG